MERAEIAGVVLRSESTTLVAQRFRKALGIPEPIRAARHGDVVDRGRRERQLRGMRGAMRQRHGVRGL